ncbi:tyrosine-protein phosphatase [Parabacteroides sp. OttesenSCG-928-N08]|nr:tyrosine-protein phosphatase [Parabacteroides sp. OttesenSCG-928-N08]
MWLRYISYFIGLVALCGCSSESPRIHTLCERDGIGNYIIKWEAEFPLEGLVKIYVSNNPEKFTNTQPAITADIADGIATYITNDNVTRLYFRLVFNDKYQKVVGARVVSLEHVHNFRDLGGYASTQQKKTIRWGKVYRSGSLSDMTNKDSVTLVRLGIRTIIDLRGDEEIESNPIRFDNAHIVSIPIQIRELKSLHQRIMDGRMRKRDAIIYLQDQYLSFIDTYNEQFAEAIDLFTDPANYPIVFSCDLGKDRAGFLAALLLSVVDVSSETIIDDYTLSGDYINIGRLRDLVSNLDQQGQETVTALLSSRESLIAPTLKRINKEYGSLDEYITGALHLNANKQEKIKDILLY